MNRPNDPAYRSSEHGAVYQPTSDNGMPRRPTLPPLDTRVNVYGRPQSISPPSAGALNESFDSPPSPDPTSPALNSSHAEVGSGFNSGAAASYTIQQEPLHRDDEAQYTEQTLSMPNPSHFGSDDIHVQMGNQHTRSTTTKIGIRRKPVNRGRETRLSEQTPLSPESSNPAVETDLTQTPVENIRGTTARYTIRRRPLDRGQEAQLSNQSSPYEYLEQTDSAGHQGQSSTADYQNQTSQSPYEDWTIWSQYEDYAIYDQDQDHGHPIQHMTSGPSSERPSIAPASDTDYSDVPVSSTQEETNLASSPRTSRGQLRRSPAIRRLRNPDVSSPMWASRRSTPQLDGDQA